MGLCPTDTDRCHHKYVLPDSLRRGIENTGGKCSSPLGLVYKEDVVTIHSGWTREMRTYSCGMREREALLIQISLLQNLGFPSLHTNIETHSKRYH